MRCALAVTRGEAEQQHGIGDQVLDPGSPPARRRGRAGRCDRRRLAEHEVLLLLDARLVVLADDVADGDQPEPAAAPSFRSARTMRDARAASASSRSGRSTCTRPPTHMRCGNASISGRRRGWPSGPSARSAPAGGSTPSARAAGATPASSAAGSASMHAATRAGLVADERAEGSRVEPGVGERGLARSRAKRHGAGDEPVVVEPADLGSSTARAPIEHLVGVHAEQRRGRGRERRIRREAQRRRRGEQRADAGVVDLAEHRVLPATRASRRRATA